MPVGLASCVSRFLLLTLLCVGFVSATRMVALAQGQPVAAGAPSREVLEARVQANPRDLEALVLLAKGFLDGGNPAAALPYLKAAAELRPDAGPLVFQYGATRLETGDVEGAYQTLLGLARRDPQELATRAYLARACALLAKPEELREHLSVIRRGAPGEAMLHVQLVEWTATAKAPEVALEQIAYTLGLSLPTPRQGRLLLLKGFAHNQLNQRAEAIESLRRAIAVDASEPRYYSVLLTLQGADGMKGIDPNLLREAVQRFPAAVDLLLLTGLYNLELEEYQSVREIARRMDVVAPGSAEGQLLRGHLHLVNFEFDQAAQYFQGALDKGMNTPHLQQHLGKAHEKRGDFPKAIQHYEAALAADAKRLELLLDLAQLRLNLGEHGRAAELAAVLLPLDTDNPRVHKLLADIARAGGDAEQARKHLREFKRLSLQAQGTRAKDTTPGPALSVPVP
ncbi:MAG: tetratricopeptide repeat protein [Bryobacterales bacterium]|jgi:tetratricopeptide (TPR) repeat protein|nr:tetratricopeptide repeat protein [Bryobacterales bacterium]